MASKLESFTVQKSAFEPVKSLSWNRGLGNLLKNDLKMMFTKGKWYIQMLWVLLMTNGIFTIILYEEGPTEALMLYSIFSAIWPVFSILAVMQKVIIGEKNDGTAAWILSKPVSRESYILSKFISNSIGALIFVTLVPGLVAYLELITIGEMDIDFVKFMASILISYLHVMVYLSLSLMIGSFFSNQRAVLGFGVTLFMAQEFLAGYIPSEWLYQSLVIPALEVPIAMSIMLDIPIFSYIPIIFSLVSIVVFVILAIWRFNREEL
jgi:ABC-2 type transport system permease protein